MAETAKQVLERLGRLGVAGPGAEVLHVVGVGGADQPLVWRVILRDPSRRGEVRDVAVRDGSVVSNQAVPAAYQNRVPQSPLPGVGLSTDSGQVFLIADREANRQKVGFDTLDYEVLAGGDGGSAVWVVRMVAGDGQRVGELFVRDRDAHVFRERWFVSSAGGEGSQPGSGESSPDVGEQVGEAFNEGWVATREGIGRGTEAVRSGAVRAGGAVRGFFSQLFQQEPAAPGAPAGNPPPSYGWASPAPQAPVPAGAPPGPGQVASPAGHFYH
jgi:hypothetical protein